MFCVVASYGGDLRKRPTGKLQKQPQPPRDVCLFFAAESCDTRQTGNRAYTPHLAASPSLANFGAATIKTGVQSLVGKFGGEEVLNDAIDRYSHALAP